MAHHTRVGVGRLCCGGLHSRKVEEQTGEGHLAIHGEVGQLPHGGDGQKDGHLVHRTLRRKEVVGVSGQDSEAPERKQEGVEGVLVHMVAPSRRSA